MKDISVYQLSGSIPLWLVDINMEDDIESHRYYFIDSNYQMKRVKSIDVLLEYLDKKGLELILLSDIEIYNLYKKLLKGQNKNNKNLHIYPGLAKMIDYDINVINNKIHENIINNNLNEKFNVKEKKEW